MEKLLTPEQLSESLGVKLSTIYSWTHKKMIPRAANIRLLRFRESDVLEWLAKKNIQSEQKQLKRRYKSKINNVAKKSKAGIDFIVSAAKKEILK